MATFSELQEAFDFVSFDHAGEHAAYLCIETDAIYWHSDNVDIVGGELPNDIDDPGRYLPIPHKNELDLGKPLVLQFAAAHLPDMLGTVQDIFSRRGAYARFKDLLEQRQMLDIWHTYEAERSEAALRSWCDEHGIAVEG